MEDSRRNDEVGHAALIYVHEDSTVDLYEQGHLGWESHKKLNYDPAAEGSITMQYWDIFHYYHVNSN